MSQSLQSEPAFVPPEESTRLVLSELQRVLLAVNPDQASSACRMLLDARRVFFAGAGRSGLALRMAAMRFMHLGLQVHVAGEVTAPAIAADDLLVVASASGTTTSMTLAAETAAKVGARVLAITTAPSSALAQQADVTVVLPAAAKTDLGDRASQQYAGSLFEQSVVLFFDSIFHSLWKNGSQSAEQLLVRHANLE